jgi:predicted secreted Zn-dependent protease
MEKLITHEEGHASLAEVGAQSVYETIVALPASPTCEALGEAANAAAQEKMDELKKRQQAYDDETGHGKTQGAVFP